MLKSADEVDLLIWSMKLRVNCHFWLDCLLSCGGGVCAALC